MYIKYIYQSFQKDQFWLPAALWGLFALLVGLFFRTNDPTTTARMFIGFLMPMISGGLAAYAILHDPALELQFATARPAWRLVFERLGLVMLVSALTILSFWGFCAALGVDTGMGSFWSGQLNWLIPNVTAIALACLASLLAASSMGGFAFIGTLWIFQIFARGWMAHNAIARNFLLFFGAMAPDYPDLWKNHLTLLMVAVLSLLASVWLLKKQERFI